MSAEKLSTKHKIIETARKVFNRSGYDAISLSDIAQELEMSRGNLAYHYNQKELIIQQILADLIEDLKQASFISNEFPSFKAIQDKMWTFFKLQQKYAFIFNEDRLINQFGLRDKINETAENFMDDKLRVVSYSIQLGNFKPEAYPGTYNNLVQTLWHLCFYWIRINHGITKESLDKLQKIVWSLVIPHFTKKGLIAFEKYFGKEYLESLGKPFKNHNTLPFF